MPEIADVPQPQTDTPLTYWELANQLEKGRIEVLRMAASGADLAETMYALCKNAQEYSPEMLCSVLRYDNELQTLHSLAAISLPDFYCEAIDGVEAGIGVGSCGTAAFTKQRVIVEDINTHPYWSQYKELAQGADLQSCWSEPIRGKDDHIYGTFAMYYRHPRSPSAADIQFIEVCANLAAVVFENHEYRQDLLAANEALAQSLDERSSSLKRTNESLMQALKSQHDNHNSKIALEKIQTTRSLIVGIAHEINTPVGSAVTASSHALQTLEEAITWLDQDESISKTKLLNALKTVKQGLDINASNLARASTLLDRFKEIDTDIHQEDKTLIKLPNFFADLKKAVSRIVKAHQIALYVDDVAANIQQLALWRVMMQLIENSVIHGFAAEQGGLININAGIENNCLVINYQDNGCGIPEDVGDKVFEPFYVNSREHKSLGLGLNVVLNLVKQNLHGAIRQRRAPIGARFEIIIPIDDPADVSDD